MGYSPNMRISKLTGSEFRSWVDAQVYQAKGKPTPETMQFVYDYVVQRLKEDKQTDPVLHYASVYVHEALTKLDPAIPQ